MIFWVYMNLVVTGKSIHEREQLCPIVTSTSRSMCRRGKLSLGQALLRLVKSMHTLHFPFFFLTTTTLASHLGYWNEVNFESRLTSSLIMRLRSTLSFRLLCCTGLCLGSTLSLRKITLGSIPGISLCDHAKQSLLALRKSTSLTLINGFSRDPILTTRFGFFVSIGTSSNSSTFGSCLSGCDSSSGLVVSWSYNIFFFLGLWVVR